MSIEELKKRRASVSKNTESTLHNMKLLVDESNRVADIAHDSKFIIDNLDAEFEKQTGLNGSDVLFLFAAVSLQLTRIVIINELTKIEKAGDNRIEDKLHDVQNKILGNFESDCNEKERLYYATMKHIITKKGVPYDAQQYLNANVIEQREWPFDVTSLIPEEKLHLFKGADHRFTTLGHDPIVGLVFGTANIMTNTITCVKEPLFFKGIGLPIITTNHVVYSTDFSHPHIGTYGSTLYMLNEVCERVSTQPSALVAALIKQIIHIGTDLFTPCGIQFPGASLILSNKHVEKITKYISTGDIIKANTSAKISELINLIISSLHMLLYDEKKSTSIELHSIRTKKIIMYSNAIASGSNVIWVGSNILAGNGTAIKQLDVGGLLVTINRLMHDTEYIRQIKEEFVFGEFKNLIRGN